MTPQIPVSGLINTDGINSFLNHEDGARNANSYKNYQK